MGSVGLAYQRFKAGSDTAFSQGLGDEAMGQDGNQYQGYQEDTGYSDPPFQGGGQQGSIIEFEINKFSDTFPYPYIFCDNTIYFAGMGYQPQQVQYW